MRLVVPLAEPSGLRAGAVRSLSEAEPADAGRVAPWWTGWKTGWAPRGSGAPRRWKATCRNARCAAFRRWGRRAAAPGRPYLPRPVRLLDPPQPVDAMALLPDQPPVAFTWRRVRHRVRRADGPERIAGEWWKRAGEMRSVRDYFRVEDEEGRRFWLFRRGDGEDAATGDLRWFLHGFF